MEEEAALLRVTSRQNKRGRDTERIMGHPQRPRIVLDPTSSSFHHFPIAPNRELHLPRRRLGETLWWDIQAGNQDTKAFQEAIFISRPAAAQWIPIQRLSPENKGALDTFVSMLQKQDLTHIWSYASLLATSPSVLCDLPHVHIL
jgi:hypothetical protein